MRKFLFSIVLAALGCASAAQQTFQQVYGDLAGGASIKMGGIMTADGGFFLCATSNFSSAGSADHYTMRTDSNGTVIWTSIFGFNLFDPLYAYTQLKDGSFITAGTSVTLSFDVWINRCDANGNLSWSKSVSSSANDYLFRLVPTADFGFIGAGSSELGASGNSQFWIVKGDSAGNIQWAKSIGGPLNDVAYGIIQTQDGGYLATGTSGYNPSIRSNGVLMRLDNAGNVLWTKSYGDSLPQEIRHSIQTQDGGFISTGFAYTTSPDSGEIFILKTDSAGNHQWTTLVTTVYPELGTYINQTSDGGYIVAGNFFSGQFSDALLCKLDNNGTLLWSRAYGDIMQDEATFVSETADGGLVMVANTSNFGIGEKGYLIKTDSFGLSGCNENTVVMTDTSVLTLVTDIFPSVDSGATTNTVTPVVHTGGSGSTLCNSFQIEQAILPLRIFPNPAQGAIRFELPYALADCTIEIFSTSGIQVYRKAFPEIKSSFIDTSDFSNGLYLMRLISGEKVFAAKIIIMN